MNKETKLKPELPLGFQDRRKEDLRSKNRLIEIVKKNFLLFGFEELETPSFEISENLGKFLPDKNRPMSGVFGFQDDKSWISLRYDLTAPLARFVSKNLDALPKPYKRFQIGSVFRNEKPGPGRFREFTQIDADIVGTTNNIADAEVCFLISDTLEKIGLKQNQFKINISNRKLIQGLFQDLSITEEKQKLIAIRAIDKLDRIEIKGVDQLLSKGRKDASGDFTKGAGLKDDQIKKILQFLKSENNLDKIKKLSSNDLFQQGISELIEIFDYLKEYSKSNNFVFTPTVVRGIEYYTGAIFEAALTEKIKNQKGDFIEFGSIGGGGRYDGLISRFKVTEYPATGISIGLDRLNYAIQQLQSQSYLNDEPIVICVIDKNKIKTCFKILDMLRKARIQSEIYSGDAGLKAQFKYADKRNSPAVIIFGDDEEKENKVSIKNLKKGKKDSVSIDSRDEWKKSDSQITVKMDQLINEIKKIL